VKKPATPPVPRNWNPHGIWKKLPTDPWRAPYQYLNPGLHGDIDVFSFGADGPAGRRGCQRGRRNVERRTNENENSAGSLSSSFWWCWRSSPAIAGVIGLSFSGSEARSLRDEAERPRV